MNETNNKLETVAQQFLNLWQSGACDGEARTQLQALLAVTPLAGRMIHGFPDSPSFGKLLSADEWKILSWVFGPETLSDFLGKSARDVCLFLGFGQEWLEGKLKQGMHFQLCIFPASSVSAKVATWDTIEELLKECYPTVWPQIQVHFADIRVMTYHQIQALASHDMEQANFAGRSPTTGESSDPNYMSLQRLQRLETAPTLVQVRQFLWDELGLKKLFRGDGYTYNDHGERGSLEYIAKQRPLGEIHGIAIVDVFPDKLE